MLQRKFCSGLIYGACCAALSPQTHAQTNDSFSEWYSRCRSQGTDKAAFLLRSDEVLNEWREMARVLGAQFDLRNCNPSVRIAPQADVPLWLTQTVLGQAEQFKVYGSPAIYPSLQLWGLKATLADNEGEAYYDYFSVANGATLRVYGDSPSLHKTAGVFSQVQYPSVSADKTALRNAVSQFTVRFVKVDAGRFYLAELQKSFCPTGQAETAYGQWREAAEASFELRYRCGDNNDAHSWHSETVFLKNLSFKPAP